MVSWTRTFRSGSRNPRRIFSILLGACAILAATATVALADPVAIPGNPLTVYVGPQGQMQGFLAGSTDGIYYSPNDTQGDAGFFLGFPSAGNPPSVAGNVYGFQGSAGPSSLQDYVSTGGGQGPVTGSGTAADPFTQVTQYSTTATSGVDVTQTTTYVNGAHQYTTKWVVHNGTGSTVMYRALAAADFFFEGDDRGTGVFTLGPPRFIGGTNVDSGQSGGFVETTADGSPAWAHYQELPFPDVWDNVVQQAADSGFNDTVDPDDVDNAGGVEWDDHLTTALGVGGTATYELISRVTVPAALQLNPTNAGAPQGVPINITATAVDSDGNPYAGQTLHYDTTGVNPGSGSVTLNGAGQGVITDPGTNAGGDTIAAFVDFNHDNTREPAEPQASALATFVDHVAPTCKVTVKGDRPGGGGGAGNALVITVNCNETATLSVSTSLLAPVAHHSSASDAKKKKHKKKQRTIKLPKTTATIQPGHSVPVSIKVPKRIARKYAGKKLTAKFVVTVKDGVGNKKTVKKTKKIKIAKPKHHKKHKKH
jgi:hypothetical protein